jgi:hypothetical protein
MVGPISRDEAAQCHEDCEEYSLFARLPGGELLVLNREGGRDSDDPMSKSRFKRDDYRMWVHGPTGHMLAVFNHSRQEQGITRLWKVSVRRPDWSTLHEVDIYDNTDTWRPAGHWEKGLRDLPLTDAEHALKRLPVPGFADYAPFLARANALLEHGGAPRFTAQPRG